MLIQVKNVISLSIEDEHSFVPTDLLNKKIVLEACCWIFESVNFPLKLGPAPETYQRFKHSLNLDITDFFFLI